jgi:glycosyltransferase involved in cell wall biosynthesis
LLMQVLRARPRAVHAMDLDTGVVGVVAARLLRIPFVYQCLDPYGASLPQGWPKALASAVHRIENMVISRSDVFVITDLRRMNQHRGAVPRVVVELPNVPMRPIDVQALSVADDRLTVGYIGSLVPHRSLEVLVDVVGSLSDEGVRLLLGGFGPLEAELRRRADGCPNIDVLGPVGYDDALTILGGCDVLVQLGDPTSPALRWVSPNKVFEAMALGRPLVVAEGTLAAERALESGHGVTVPYGDAAALRGAFLDLRNDPQRRAALGAAGRQCFDSRWSPDVWAEDVLDVYGDRLASEVAP